MAPTLPGARSHILQAIAEIKTYVARAPDHEIFADAMRLRAIERCLQIVTEAAKFITEEGRAKHPQIDWSAIDAMGNILRHEYFRINPDILLRVIRHDVAPLKAAVIDLSSIALLGAKDQNSNRD